MSIRDDQPKHCWICGDIIRSHGEEVRLWDLLDREESGPMHEGCATETSEDDPQRWSRTEPAEG